jgi:SAM-dependent methyltransferase
MPNLSLPANFAFPGLINEIAIGDTMFEGSGEHYLTVSVSALRAIEAALDGHPDPRRILDLACGYGRVTRILRARFPDAEITVSDIDADGVDFCQSRFRARGVHSDGDFRSLELGGAFDLVWVGSLATHLSEGMLRQLLDCIARHLIPDGMLVISSHGRWVADQMPRHDYGLGPGTAQAVCDEYERYGYGYSDYPGSRDYGVSLIGRDWLDRTLAGSPLQLEMFAERGWDDNQDIIVLRPAAPARGRIRGEYPKRLLGRFATLAKVRASRGSDNSAGWFEARLPRRAAARKSRKHSIADQKMMEEFDEEWYLATYADVAGAVRRGHLRSGFQHFQHHGRAEGRLPRPP